MRIAQNNLQLAALDERRRALGLTYAMVAEISGVSFPTAYRILADQNTEASWANVHAIAEALGMNASLQPQMSVEEMRHRQAVRKATWLTKMLQATSALEGQAVDPEHLDQMRNQTVHELLAGPNRNLWAKQ